MIPHSFEEWALRGRAVVTPQGIRPAAVVVRGEKIAAVVEPHDVGAGVPVTDVDDKMILPGLVDTHVHINEPGRTDWEGFETATRAAAAGGITTLVDMPLNSSPVTTTVVALNAKREATAGKLWVDVGFHGGVVPGNTEHIRPLIREGVCAFKAFLCPSGIDEFPNVTEGDLRQVMPILAEAGVPLFVHAELMSPLPASVEKRFAANPRSYRAYLATRPTEWEIDAIGLMMNLCREYGCPVHIVHLSAGDDATDLIIAAAKEKLLFTFETCPHYLVFADGEIPDGDARYKCAPPIRNFEHRSSLMTAVLSKGIHTIGSDHSPAPPEFKRLEDGDLRRAWGGIASLQLLLSATWTAFDWLPNSLHQHVLGALTERPAALVGLVGRKGAIVADGDADLVVFDGDAEFVVSDEMLHHRHKATPYLGRTLRGVVEATYIRGRKVYEREEFFGRPAGQTLRRDASAKRR
jgi:allantoinase